jgi:3-deoxy-D-manno-octulosonate 8-phosphate phosphatase (KDO 8-P phosphatase)
MTASFSANRSWTPELDRKARGLSWLLLDVDGVLTDGLLHLAADGEAFKSFHVRDGLAIQLARSAGLEVGILSARASEVVARRAAELGVVEVLQGEGDKRAAFRGLLARRGVPAQAVAYVGDDLQDLAVLGEAGLSAAPADAVPQVRAAVDFVTEASGGRGCVRELVERLLVARDAWSTVLSGYAARDPKDAASR